MYFCVGSTEMWENGLQNPVTKSYKRYKLKELVQLTYRICNLQVAPRHCRLGASLVVLDCEHFCMTI